MTVRVGEEMRFRRWHEPRGSRPRSLWFTQAIAREAPGAELTALRGPMTVDVCIVGGGFTGLWTAIRLREADKTLRVVVLEADLCGSGASGRNSGGIGHLWSRLPTLTRLLDSDGAIRMVRASEEIVVDMERAIAQYGIECELRHAPSVWVATTPGQVGAWNGVLRAADKLAITPPYRVLDKAEMRRLFGTGPFFGGVVSDDIARVQPAMLGRGLRRVAASLGVEIYERTPVIKTTSGAHAVVVTTEHGEVRAQQVVLAACAWMAHFKDFRDSVFVTSSDIIATDPIPEVIEARGLASRPGSINSRMMVNYGGISSDGRVYLGRGGGTLAYDARISPAFDQSLAQAREVEEDFRYLYPELADIPIRHSWSGPVDRSTTGFPWFGRSSHDQRIHYAIGYTGHGVAASAIAGHVLTSSVLDRRDEWASLGELFWLCRSGKLPPEPIRYVGGLVVRRAIGRKERAEREGRQPSRLDRYLSRLAPATIIDVSRRQMATGAAR